MVDLSLGIVTPHEDDARFIGIVEAAAGGGGAGQRKKSKKGKKKGKGSAAPAVRASELMEIIAARKRDSGERAVALKLHYKGWGGSKWDTWYAVSTG